MDNKTITDALTLALNRASYRLGEAKVAADVARRDKDQATFKARDADYEAKAARADFDTISGALKAAR